MTIQRLHVGPRLSQVAIHGGVVYSAGIVADDPGADVVGQTQQILAKIDQYLAEAGSDKTLILSTTIWLADIGLLMSHRFKSQSSRYPRAASPNGVSAGSPAKRISATRTASASSW